MRRTRRSSRSARESPRRAPPCPGRGRTREVVGRNGRRSCPSRCRSQWRRCSSRRCFRKRSLIDLACPGGLPDGPFELPVSCRCRGITRFGSIETTFSSSTFQVHPSNLWHLLGSDACAALAPRLSSACWRSRNEVVPACSMPTETQQGVVDPEAVQGLRGNWRGSAARVGDERLDAAEASGKEEGGRFPAPCGRFRVGHGKPDITAGPAGLATLQFKTRMLGKAGIIITCVTRGAFSHRAILGRFPGGAHSTASVLMPRKRASVVRAQRRARRPCAGGL